MTNVFDADSESSRFLKEYVEGKAGQRDTLETTASGKKLRMREAGKGGGAGRRGAGEGQGGSGGAHTHAHAAGASAPSHLAVRKGVKGEAGKKGSLGTRAAANAGGMSRVGESLGDDAAAAEDESDERQGATSCPPFVRLFDEAGAAILSQALEDKALFADEILGDKRGRYHINHRSLLIRPVRILPTFFSREGLEGPVGEQVTVRTRLGLTALPYLTGRDRMPTTFLACSVSPSPTYPAGR